MSSDSIASSLPTFTGYYCDPCPYSALVPASPILLWSWGLWTDSELISGCSLSHTWWPYWTPDLHFSLQREKKSPSIGWRRAPLWTLIRACPLGPSMGELQWSRCCPRRSWTGASARPCESSAHGLRMMFSNLDTFSWWSLFSLRSCRHGIKSSRRVQCFIFASGYVWSSETQSPEGQAKERRPGYILL